MKKSTIRLLIIEDDPVDLKTISTLIEGCVEPRFVVAHAGRLDEGLAMLGRGHFDAVLLDLDLPDSRGLDGIERLAEARAGIPVIVLAVSGDENACMQALRSRAADCLIKDRLDSFSVIRAVLYAIERKRAEEALSSAKQEWERTFDSVPDLIAVLDNRYRIMRVNRAMAECLGLTPEQCVGRTCYESIHGTSGPPSVCPHAMTMADGRQHTVELHEGRLNRCFSVTTTPLLDERGKMRGSVHVARDITDRKKAEDVLRKSHDELEKRVQDRTVELERANRELGMEIAERKKAEESVRAERKRLNDVLDMLPGYVILLTPDYRVFFANRFFRDRFGEDRGRRCFEYLFGRAEPCENCETYKVLKTRASHHWEWLGPDGRNYDIHDFPFTDTDGSPLIMEMGIDVTELKRAKEALQKINETLEQRVAERTAELHESRENLNRAQAVAHFGNWRLDLRRNVLSCSEEAYRIFGIPVGAPLTYETFLDAVHPDDREYVDRKWKANLRGEPYDIEHRIVVGDAVKWIRGRAELEFDKDGTLCGGFGTVQDVTARKRAEAKISSLAQFPAENPQPVLRATADGALLYANRSAVIFLRAMEWKKGESLPGPLPDIIRRTLRNGVQESVELDDLHDRVWSILLAPIANERYVNLYGYDITEQKRAQKVLERDREEMEKLVRERTSELLAARHEMERAKRLADVGALAATVAHELRNPLAAIKMAAYNATKKSGDPSLAKHLNNIDAKVDESDQIINNLLFYSRLQAPHYEHIELYWILKESADHACGMRKNVSFIRQYEALKGLKVDVDALQMKELFNNVINNACDAVADGSRGRIVLKGDVSEREGAFVVTVRDNGAGIEKEDLDKVFDPFFSTKAKGTGLGLTVSSHIVNLHGGKMSVKSTKGRGTTMTISIPLRRKKNSRRKP